MGRPSKRQLILEALQEVEATSKRKTGITRIELQIKTGTSAATVHMHLKELHEAHLVYISSWRAERKKHTGPMQPCFRLGNNSDAIKPPILTSSETGRRTRQTIVKKDGIHALKEIRHLEYLRHHLRTRRPKRDPLTSAFFGVS